MRAVVTLWAAAAIAIAQPQGSGVDAVVRALDPQAGEQIADIGAGRGEYAFSIARIVGGAGKVYAVDIDETHAVRPMRERAERDGVKNVDVILSRPDDPLLPDGALDAVLMVNAYHEIKPYEAMLARVHRALKAGGRLLIVDSMPGRTRGQPRDVQTGNHMIAPELVEAELRKAGFRIDSRKEDMDQNPASDHVRWAVFAHRDGGTAE